MAIDSARIQNRRGTSAALTQANEVLGAGELAFETDTGKYKIGDGVSTWSQLNYAGLRVPGSDNTVYVLKNGAYVAATVVEQPYGWSPSIDNVEDIVLTVDQDMTAYQLTGQNVSVAG